MTTLKEMGDAIEKKYNIEDACLKFFVRPMFLYYKISYSKTIGLQV